MRGILTRTAVLLAATLGMVGCATAAASSGPTHPQHVYLSIATGGMLGVDENLGPAYVPSSFALPANSDVTVTVSNFDDATPLTSALVSYAKATDIEGSFAVETMDPTKPNDPGVLTTATSLDPNNVSHTFTISKLGINVPISPKAKTTFTFHTPAAGTDDWRCFDPCGAGASGWQGAMALPGRMSGQVTFE